MLKGNLDLLKELKNSPSQSHKLAAYFIDVFRFHDHFDIDLTIKGKYIDLKVFNKNPNLVSTFNNSKTHPFSLNVVSDYVTFYFRVNHTFFNNGNQKLNIEIETSSTKKKGGESFVKLFSKTEIAELINYVFEKKLKLKASTSFDPEIENKKNQEEIDLEEQEKILKEINPKNKVQLEKELQDYLVKPTKTVEINRKYFSRDNVIISYLKELRNFECQICGHKIQKKNGGFYIEAAHIKPKSEMGDESPDNILILCPNHHKEFDEGDTTITEKTKDFIKFKMNGKEYYVSLKI